MSVEEIVLILISIIAIYTIVALILNQKNILEKYNISFYGPALMWRTQKGKKFISKIAEYKKFWLNYSNVGIFACLILMVLMMVLLLSTIPAVFQVEDTVVSSNPQLIVGLPGLNPIIPLGFGIIAFIVAIVVHELSHGILSKVQNIDVKSLGILYLIIPIGAFCEPDEEKLKESSNRKRLRVFAAGPMANIITAFVFLGLATLLIFSSVQVASDGAGVFQVVDDSPAKEQLNLKPGMIITSINNSEISSISDFKKIMNATNANQTINITYVDGEKSFSKKVKLADEYYIRYQSLKDEHGEVNSSLIDEISKYKGEGYLGVWTTAQFQSDSMILKNPFHQFPFGFLYYIGLPLFGFMEGYSILSEPFNNFLVVNSFIPTGMFWNVVNVFYWIFWFNFMVATFNVLPMLPLDGGYMFSDLIDGFLKRFKKNLAEEKRDKIVSKVTTSISFIILGIVLSPIVIPNILGML
ncbi:MAG: site-2 protease family protein [Candidatus Thermoplasmatota archaeon]